MITLVDYFGFRLIVMSLLPIDRLFVTYNIILELKLIVVIIIIIIITNCILS